MEKRKYQTEFFCEKNRFQAVVLTIELGSYNRDIFADVYIFCTVAYVYPRGPNTDGGRGSNRVGKSVF